MYNGYNVSLFLLHTIDVVITVFIAHLWIIENSGCWKT